jgi:hypothetical protein
LGRRSRNQRFSIPVETGAPPLANHTLKDKAQIGGNKAYARSALAGSARIRYTIQHMAGAASLPNKRDVARALLLKGTVFVHLDPRTDDVIVPQWLKRQPQLVLQVGLDLPIPIPDLRVDDVGVYGTLSFNRSAFTCIVPWEAVFAVVGDDGRGMVWPGSMPAEIAAEVEREADRARAAEGERHGAIDEVQPARRPRQPNRNTERAKPAPAISPAPRRAAVEPPNLELISGDKRARGQAERRRERRALPSYLRVVK